MKYYCGYYIIIASFILNRKLLLIDFLKFDASKIWLSRAECLCLSAVNMFSRCAPLVLYCRRTNIINSDFSEAFARFEGGQGDVFNYPRRNKVRAWVAKGMCLYTYYRRVVAKQTTSHFGAFDTPSRHTYSYYHPYFS